MYGEISSMVSGERASGADLVSTAEALAALCWLLRQPGPGQLGPGQPSPGRLGPEHQGPAQLDLAVRTTRGVATIDGRARRRAARGRLATDPGA